VVYVVIKHAKLSFYMCVIMLLLTLLFMFTEVIGC